MILSILGSSDKYEISQAFSLAQDEDEGGKQY